MKYTGMLLHSLKRRKLFRAMCFLMTFSTIILFVYPWLNSYAFHFDADIKSTKSSNFRDTVESQHLSSKDYGKGITGLQHGYNEDFTKLRQEFSNNITKLHRDYSRNVTRLHKSYIKNVTKVNQDYTKNITRLNHDYLKNITRLHQDFSSLIFYESSVPSFSRYYDTSASTLIRRSLTTEESFRDIQDAIKRSQEYCNVLDNFNHDEGGNIPPKLTLSAVIVIVRHGDRTPIYSLPNYKLGKKISCNLRDMKDNKAVNGFFLLMKSLAAGGYLSNIPWSDAYPKGSKCGFGQLTSWGFLQMISLGRRLRKIYIEAKNLSVSSLNSPLISNVYVRSTESSRALQSAVGFLYGFLSDSDFKQTNIEFTKDTYLCKNSPSLSCYCPAANRFYMAMENDRREWFDKNDRFLEQQIKMELGNIFNVSWGRIPWLGVPLEVIMSHACHGLSLPCHQSHVNRSRCVTWSVVKKIWDFIDKSWKCPFNCTNMEKFDRLISQPLLHEIVHRFLEIARYKTSHKASKFHLFSGHDKTISAVLGALGIQNRRWPPYASNIVFELYNHRRKQFYIRILYNGKDITNQVIFCQKKETIGQLCPFDNFMYFVFYETNKYFRKSSYAEMCR